MRTESTFLLTLTLASFGSSMARAQATTSDSAGIEIVKVPTVDRRLNWTFEPVMSAGGVEDTLLALSDLATRHIAANDAGRVFVLDWMTGRVLVIEPSGESGKSLGRKGRGPGELAAPRGIDIAPDGTVLVLEPTKRSFVRWNAAGDVIPETPFAVSPFGGQMRVTDAGVMMQTQDMRSRQTRMKLTHVLGDSSVDLAAQTWPVTRPPTYRSCPNYSVESPPFFWPWFKWDASGSYTAVVISDRYEIDVFQNDKLVRSIRRDIAPVEVTDEIIAEEIEPITIRGCTIPSAERASVLGYMPVLPVIAAVAIGPQGRIWVQRHIPGPERDKIDILTVDGDYLGTLVGVQPFPVAFAGDDQIVELTEDSLDVPVVRMHRVKGN